MHSKNRFFYYILILFYYYFYLLLLIFISIYYYYFMVRQLQSLLKVSFSDSKKCYDCRFWKVKQNTEYRFT